MKARSLLICLSFIGIGAILATKVAAQLKVEDTLGIWLFDEGRGKKIEEMTGKGLDGSLMNDPQWVDGRFGKAVSFDGRTQFIELNDPLNVGEFGMSHSISVWVNPGRQQKTWADMLGNHGQPGGYEIEQRAGEHNRFYFGMMINDAWQGGAPDERPASLLVAGEWNHLVVLREGKTVKHYLNGKKTVEYKIAGDRVDDSTANYRFGMSTCCGNDRQFSGILDEIVIFKKAVSEKEIRALSKGVGAALVVEGKGKLTTTWGKLKIQYKPLE